jgi:uncharacterized protein YdhG (YjbR/CyaY superfamily)
MQINADTPDDYIAQLPEDRKEILKKLRKTIQDNLPEGFKEVINYGMIGYVVPHSLYPAGYHAKPELPLPFIHIASQKNFIAVYHMGIYANPNLMDWFTTEYPKHCKLKLDMGKSCIRFKKPDQLPFELMGELATKISVEDWVKTYEKNIKR